MHVQYHISSQYAYGVHPQCFQHNHVQVGDVLSCIIQGVVLYSTIARAARVKVNTVMYKCIND